MATIRQNASSGARTFPISPARLYPLINQILTCAILFSWSFYVIALSQIGKPSALRALGEAVKAVGHGSAEELRGAEGLGVWRAMAGCECGCIV